MKLEMLIAAVLISSVGAAQAGSLCADTAALEKIAAETIAVKRTDRVAEALRSNFTPELQASLQRKYISRIDAGQTQERTASSVTNIDVVFGGIVRDYIKATAEKVSSVVDLDMNQTTTRYRFVPQQKWYEDYSGILIYPAFPEAGKRAETQYMLHGHSIVKDGGEPVGDMDYSAHWSVRTNSLVKSYRIAISAGVKDADGREKFFHGEESSTLGDAVRSACGSQPR